MTYNIELYDIDQGSCTLSLFHIDYSKKVAPQFSHSAAVTLSSYRHISRYLVLRQPFTGSKKNLHCLKSRSDIIYKKSEAVGEASDI